MATELQPLAPIEPSAKNFTVFLAGSIDNGMAEDWQSQLIAMFQEEDIVFLNPRRDDWNPDLKPTIDTPEFKAQVLWEIEGLEKADVIAMYFSPSSQAPITLLELGLFASSGRIILCCPEGYWRKGNVDVVAEKFQIEQVNSLQLLAKKILNKKTEKFLS